VFVDFADVEKLLLLGFLPLNLWIVPEYSQLVTAELTDDYNQFSGSNEVLHSP